MKNSPKAPTHLHPDTQAWWTYVHTNWQLEQHHTRLLTQACIAWDRAEEARQILKRDGIVIGGRKAAVRPHPCIAIERDSRLAFARLVAQLNLDAETAPDPAVRDARRSNRPGGWKAPNGQTQQQQHST
jgi:phage terminase small subunit